MKALETTLIVSHKPNIRRLLPAFHMRICSRCNPVAHLSAAIDGIAEGFAEQVSIHQTALGHEHDVQLPQQGEVVVSFRRAKGWGKYADSC